jgi:hypothetical protein
MDKINALSTGEKLVGAAGILLFLDSLILPWYKVSFSFAGFAGSSVSRSGWESPGAIWSIIAALIGLALFGVIVLTKFTTVQMPALPQGITWGMVYLGGSALAVLCIIIKWINENSYISYGFWLGFILALVMLAGGYLLYSEEHGTSGFGMRR